MLVCRIRKGTSNWNVFFKPVSKVLPPTSSIRTCCLSPVTCSSSSGVITTNGYITNEKSTLSASCQSQIAENAWANIRSRYADTGREMYTSSSCTFGEWERPQAQVQFNSFDTNESFVIRSRIGLLIHWKCCWHRKFDEYWQPVKWLSFVTEITCRWKQLRAIGMPYGN